MEEIYLVAYTCETNALTHERQLKSISFGRDFTALRRVVEIVYKIETQSGDRSVQVMAITPLHKLIDYAGENKTNSLSSSKIGH